MFEDDLCRKSNRRTRRERTKRRERYLLSSANKNKSAGLSSEDISSSSESLQDSVENNNSSRSRVHDMGNNLLVDILSLFNLYYLTVIATSTINKAEQNTIECSNNQLTNISKQRHNLIKVTRYIVALPNRYLQENSSKCPIFC